MSKLAKNKAYGNKATGPVFKDGGSVVKQTGVPGKNVPPLLDKKGGAIKKKK